MQFLNPTNDLAFKKIFGNEKKKHILISFLNSILGLPEHQQIAEVTLLNSNQAPQMLGAKETILDVRCYDQSGAEYIVEMQVLPKEFFDKRVLYYAAKSYSQQLTSGQGYNLLKPVIFLGILNFKFTDDPHYISNHGIHNIETREHLLQDFRFTFAELTKFHKELPDLITIEDKWLYFLKHAQNLTAIPEMIDEAAIREAFELINIEYWNKDSLNLYTMRDIYREDGINEVAFGYKKGFTAGKADGQAAGQAAGLAAGLSEGLAEGLAKGLAEGEASGQRKAQYEIARIMLAKKMPLEIIAECTGLSIEIIAAEALEWPLPQGER